MLRMGDFRREKNVGEERRGTTRKDEERWAGKKEQPEKVKDESGN